MGTTSLRWTPINTQFVQVPNADAIRGVIPGKDWSGTLWPKVHPDAEPSDWGESHAEFIIELTDSKLVGTPGIRPSEENEEAEDEEILSRWQATQYRAFAARGILLSQENTPPYKNNPPIKRRHSSHQKNIFLL